MAASLASSQTLDYPSGLTPAVQLKTNAGNLFGVLDPSILCLGGLLSPVRSLGNTVMDETVGD
ncbi:hypothetical protein WMY93_015396 [Mugilogobius chulae]|uniref:Uncharacterized protein n=1 Tax=Mugilogobius chulae TaxID=88201 RepID=A0AAW0NPY3_9GOBI